MVVSEAVTNAVVHAYRDRERPGQVHVSASLEDEGVEVAVADDGIGLRPRADSPGVGLGMPLIADLADRVEIPERIRAPAWPLISCSWAPRDRTAAASRATVGGRAERTPRAS